jgi:hypothetical protein
VRVSCRVCVCDRADALFKTFDLNKYPLLREGLIKHKGSYVRGDEDIPQVYILGRPFGTTLADRSQGPLC